MEKKFLPRNKELRPLASKLRAEATKEERILWSYFLAKYPLRFYRQRIIGSFIADFYCHKAKLVIELDGSQHYEEKGMQRDEKRTEYFNELGITVLRFSNLDVLKNLRGVCEEIDRRVKERFPMGEE